MRFLSVMFLSAMTMIAFADELVVPKFDVAVVAFMKDKIAEVESGLKTYHAVQDKLSEKPIGPYEDFFDETKFKTFPVGIKQQIREHKLYTKFLGKEFADVEEVNGALKDYLKLKSKTEDEDKKAKDLLTRKRDLGRLPWAKCESETKKIDEKSYRKLRDAYWKMAEKYFKKYKI